MEYKKTESREDKIFKIIEDHGKISYNQLKRLVIEKKICSDKTFRKLLEEMVSQRIVFHSPEGRQNVYYYPNKKLFDLEKELENRIDYLISTLEQKFTRLQEQYYKLSQDNQASAFSSLCTLLFCLKMKIAFIGYGALGTNFVKHRIGGQSTRVNQLSDKIMNFISAQPEHLKILKDTDTRFGLLAMQLEKEFDLLMSNDKKD